MPRRKRFVSLYLENSSTARLDISRKSAWLYTVLTPISLISL